MAVAACGEVKDTPDAAPSIDAAPDAPSAVCTANALSCGAGDALFMCDGEGSQLTKVQDCQYGCNTDHCKACQANSTFCNGNNLSSCDANGELSNPMTCMFGCQGMACNACMPSTTYCSGTNAVTCTAAGQPGASQACGAAGCQNGVCNSCTPNTTTCQGDNLVVCNGGGTVSSATSCALGCSTTGTPHCKALVPSFGVPAPSGTLPDLNVNADATLDITNCAALDVKLTLGGVTSAVPSTQILNVTQAGGSPICVVKYGKIDVADTFTLTVVNSTAGHALSLTATGDITIAGKITFNTAGQGPSPGGTVVTQGTNANGYYIAAGAGGAGGVRAGGDGGACTGCSNPAGGAGGAMVTLGSTLISGSSGGNVINGASTYASGGRGGGALHLVSLTRVTVAATGVIGLNGGGGTGCASLLTSQRAPCNTAGGGGSGGVLVVEAPVVNVSAGAIAAANGGGGAGGGWHTVSSGMFFFATHYNGQPGQLSTTRAAGGDIDNTTSGDGGYEADGTASPSANGAPSDSGAATYDGGGGGGAKGFISFRARAAANVMITFGAVVSPAPSTSAVNAQ